MNIAYFLLPKIHTAYLYDDCTFRQVLEKMLHHGYTAIPVINREGKYVGTVSEGDFLWQQYLIHISEPTRILSTSYAVYCLKKKTNKSKTERLCVTATH